MENIRIYYFLFFSMICCSYSLQAQDIKDGETIAQVYELLQTRNSGPSDIKIITPKIKWDEMENTANLDERNNISFPAIMKNHWRNLRFRNLKFSQEENSSILVTGTIIGRQPTECGIISNDFAHAWLLENGEIVGFSE